MIIVYHFINQSTSTKASVSAERASNDDTRFRRKSVCHFAYATQPSSCSALASIASSRLPSQCPASHLRNGNICRISSCSSCTSSPQHIARALALQDGSGLSVASAFEMLLFFLLWKQWLLVIL